MLASFGLFLIGGFLAGLVLEPEFATITAAGYSDRVDAALQSRAARWLAYDWAVWGISLVTGIALLLALSNAGPGSRRG